MIKRQRILAIVLASLFVLSIPLYFFVIVPLTKILTENTDNNPDREIMYTQTERANIKSIEVKNDHGSYKFVYLEGLNKYVIEGHEFASYDPTLFSQLVIDTGYTLSKATVENENAEKLSDYGLDDESNPASFTLTTKEDVQYKVLIGDRIVSGGGYYARMDGEKKVYVLDTTLATTVLSPIEAFITPVLVNPSSLTTYFDVKDFAIYKGAYVPPEDDKDEEKEEQGGTSTDNNGTAEGDKKPYDPEKNLVIKLHYLGQKQGMEGYGDYGNNATYYMDYPGNGIYNPSMYVNSVLQMFMSYQGSETVKLEPKTEDFEKYGLLGKSEYTLYVVNYMTGKDEEGKDVKIEVINRVYYSEVMTDEETGEKFRYAHSLFYNEGMSKDLLVYNNIIAKVPEYNCEFLNYDLNTWVDSKLFSTVISTVTSMRVEAGETDILFNFTGEGESLVITEANGHKPEVKNFKKFYQTVLAMTKGGFVNKTEDELKDLTSDDKNMTMKLTVKLKNGNTLELKFYSYGVQTYYTVNGEGQFYLPTTQVSKVIADAIRVTKDEIVYVDNAY